MIRTERLVLRPFTIDDAPFILRLVNEPSWIENIGDRHVHSIADAQAYLENGPMKNYRELGFGFWMVERLDDGSPIGMCGITQRTYLDHPDLGFALLPEYTGMGYAMEAAQATVRYARTTLGLPVLYAFALPANNRSIRLLEKLNFTYDRNLMLDGEVLSLFRSDL